jgi:hypothetical protein
MSCADGCFTLDFDAGVEWRNGGGMVVVPPENHPPLGTTRLGGLKIDGWDIFLDSFLGTAVFLTAAGFLAGFLTAFTFAGFLFALDVFVVVVLVVVVFPFLNTVVVVVVVVFFAMFT